MQRLLADLREVIAGGGKSVVFSSLKPAIRHLDKVLTEEGIGHAKVAKGDSQVHQETAVSEFNNDPECHVFLLHAGQAAAGLTLTVAQHVFLLEPFLTAAEEAQATNRCHRIGQTGDVTCTTYYCVGTVEERLLAYRRVIEGTIDCSSECIANSLRSSTVVMLLS